jgi:hypothetical protein
VLICMVLFAPRGISGLLAKRNGVEAEGRQS